MTVTLVTAPHTEVHAVFCDAFLAWGGYLILNDALVQVDTMRPLDDGRTEWRMHAAAWRGRA